MHDHKAEGRLRAQITQPVILAMLLLAGLVAGLILWSTHKADHFAVGRQRALVQTVLEQSKKTLAHDQESSTVWDDAVRQVHAKSLDLPWLDNNLGVWFHDYFGSDQIYILDPDDRSVYAMVDGKRTDPGHYAAVSAQIEPLAGELRDRMLRNGTSVDDPTMRSPGATDLGYIDGHPAIISVKPIIPDTDAISQKIGGEFLHISIRYLDGNFATRLAQQYWFDGGRFAIKAPRNAEEAAIALRSARGHVVGYYVWKPFRPGASVLSQIAPPLLAVFLALIATTWLLLRKMLRGTIALQASEAQAQHLAFHDTLTGLANRALFEDRFNHALANARRDGHAIALFYLDLDRFKAVNDTLGHPSGDALIHAVGQRLTQATRETDTVARLGGDEFAIIQEGVRSISDIEILCLRIIEAISEPFDLEGAYANIGVSIGIAIAPEHGIDRSELSRKADIALYQAKAAGRGRFMIFAEEMDDEIKTRQTIERDLREALTRDDALELYYQPIVSSRTENITGVEALIRWHHPEHGSISPILFIPIAEETGLIEALGEWVLKRACMEAAEWPVQSLSVNISPIQLRNPAFAKRTLAIIEECGFSPARLELEITETCLIDNAAECQPNIAALRARGIHIALDDFGTGYSSFNHFRQLEVDRLKIDRTFVSAITTAGHESPIVKAIVDLATTAGIAVTAEGVETAQQSQYLTKIGCSSLQGYFHGRPVTALQFGEMLIPVLKVNRA